MTTSNNKSYCSMLKNNASVKVINVVQLIEGCTGSCFGLAEIEQECYHCPKCDPKKTVFMCKYCIEQCHKNCNIDNENFNSKEYLVSKCEKFACKCLFEFGHKPNQVLNHINQKCTFKEFDLKFITDKKAVETMNKFNLCSFCLNVCKGYDVLKEKNDKEKLLSDIKTNSNQRNSAIQITDIDVNAEEKECKCDHSNHSSFNEFLFVTDLEKYYHFNKINIIPIQLVNYCFMNESILGRYVEEIKSYKDVEMREEEDYENYYNKIGNLIVYISRMMNKEFKYYYFAQIIIDIFPLKFFNRAFEELKGKKKYCDLIFSFLHFYCNTQIRTDLRKINKALTSNDYISGSIISRLIYREKFKKFFLGEFNDVSVVNEIIEKYDNNFHHLKEFVIKIIKYMDYVTHYNDFNIYNYHEAINYFLRFILFIIKANILDIEELKIVSENLDSLISKLKFIEKQEDNKISSEENKIFSDKINIFSLFIEIIYIISVQYNDLVVEKIILTNEEDIKDKFIHSNKNFGKIILRSIIKANQIICDHYKLVNIKKSAERKSNQEKINSIIKANTEQKLIFNKYYIPPRIQEQGFLEDKILNLYNETLEIFSIANNTYQRQIQRITKEEINDFKEFKLNTNKKKNKTQFGFRNLKNDIEKTIYTFFNNITSKSEQFKPLLEIDNILTDFQKKICGINSQGNDRNVIKESGLSIEDNNESSFLVINKKVDSDIKKSIASEVSILKNDINKEVKIEMEQISNKVDSNIEDNKNNEYKKVPQNNNNNNNNNDNNNNYNNNNDNKFQSKNLKNIGYINTYEEKINCYRKKIKEFNQLNIFVFFDIIIKNFESINEELMSSMIDDTLTSLLNIQIDPRVNCESSIQMHLSFLTIYFFSSRTMRYFITGKNLNCILKLLAHFCINEKNYTNISNNNMTNVRFLLEYIQIFFEGIDLYKVNLKQNTFITKLKECLIKSHLTYFHEIIKIPSNAIYLREYNSQLIKIANIFFMFSNFYDTEQFNEIKYYLLNLFQETISIPTFFNNSYEKKALNKKIDLQSYKIEKKKKNKRGCVIEGDGLLGNTNISDFNTQSKLVLAFFELFSKNTYFILKKDYHILEKINHFFEYYDQDLLDLDINDDESNDNASRKKSNYSIENKKNIKESNTPDVPKYETNKALDRLIKNSSAIDDNPLLGKKTILSEKKSFANDTLLSSKKITFFDCKKNDFDFTMKSTKDNITKIQKENKVLKKLYKYLDSKSQILHLFKCSILSLKDKLIILSYLKTICFIELKNESNLSKINNVFTNIDFIKFLLYKEKKFKKEDKWIDFQGYSKMFSKKGEKLNSNISEETISTETQKSTEELEREFLKVKRIKLLTNLYSSELSQLDKIFSMKTQGELFVKIQYLKEIIKGTKLIADFYFLNPNIWKYPLKDFYDLSVLLIEHSNEIIELIKMENGTYIEEDILKDILIKMKKIEFNIYDTREVYKHLNHILQIIIETTKINKNYSLDRFFKTYDEIQEANFTADSLVEDKDYEYFYEQKADDEKDENEDEKSILNKIYNDEFKEVEETVILNLIREYNSEVVKINYRRSFNEYFKVYLNTGITDQRVVSLLCIITKLLYYDNEKMKEIVYKDVINNFFTNFEQILSTNLFESAIVLKNPFVFEKGLELVNSIKLIMQYLLLLGNGNSSDFQKNIFGETENQQNIEEEEEKVEEGAQENDIVKKDIKVIKNRVPMFEFVLNIMKEFIIMMDSSFESECELPYDKFIIVIKNTNNFIIEYLVSIPDYFEKIEKSVSDFLFKEKKIIKILTTNLSESLATNSYSLRPKILCFIKVEILKFLTSYLSNCYSAKIIDQLYKNRFGTFEIFNQIIINFKNLMNKLNYNTLKEYHSYNKCVKELLMLYSRKNYFRDNIELRLCFQLFTLLTIFEVKYKHTEISYNFSNLKDNENLTDKKDEWGLKSNNALKIYQFFSDIVLTVTVNTAKENKEDILADNEDKKEEEESEIEDEHLDEEEVKSDLSINKDNSEVSEQSLNSINENDDELNKSEEDNNEDKTNTKKEKSDSICAKTDINKVEDNKSIVNINENSESQDDPEYDNEDSNDPERTVIFIRPYLSFFISKNSKRKFKSEVNRENPIEKYNDLFFESDYLLFDMVNDKNYILSNEKNKFFCDLNFKFLEWVNFLIIVIFNAVLIFNHYDKESGNPLKHIYLDTGGFKREYNTTLLVISAIHIVFTIIIFSIWITFKFVSCFLKNVMKLLNKTFVFRQKKDNGHKKVNNKLFEFFNEDNTPAWNVIQDLIENEPFSTRFKIAFIDSILLNREINIFVYSFFMTILYIATKIELFLLFQNLFLVNISTDLYAIYIAILQRWYPMSLVMMFTYIITYIFSWFAYYFISENFIFKDVRDFRLNLMYNFTSTNETENSHFMIESFCSSILQCWLYLIDYGIRPQFGT